MWKWDFAISILPDLLKAMKLTISATVVGFALALMAGLLIAIARRSEIRWVNLTVKAFVEFIRNTPLLVQLYFIFYVLPEFGISLSPFEAGVIGLGLHYSTYLSEVFRSGIDAVPKGQWEASTALNFSKARTWFSVILPQAVPPVLPVLGNYFVVMFKETPLLSAITYVEMLGMAKIIGSENFRYLEAFTLVGLLFLLLSYPSSFLFRRLEDRLKQRYVRKTTSRSV